MKKLSNTIVVIGKEADEIATVAKQYKKIKPILDDLKKTEKQCISIIKSHCTSGGTYQADNYLITVTDVSAKETIDTNKLKTLYPNVYEAVKKQGSASVRLETIEVIK